MSDMGQRVSKVFANHGFELSDDELLAMSAVAKTIERQLFIIGDPELGIEEFFSGAIAGREHVERAGFKASMLWMLGFSLFLCSEHTTDDQTMLRLRELLSRAMGIEEVSA